MANVSNMRKELFPELVAAYETWSDSGNSSQLEHLAQRSLPYWQALATDLLEIFETNKAGCQQAVVSCIESRVFNG
jgi:hypothetical protein